MSSYYFMQSFFGLSIWIK